MSTEFLVWLGIAGALLGRLGLSLHDIRLPGLQQDETLFVNAATLRLPGLDIVHQIGGVPLMIYSYTGALKSWIYDPIFAVAGTSPASIRVPSVVIVCIGLALVYPAVRTLINRPVALLSFAVLCFDNSVFWLTRNDVGPSALEFFFKCAALFCAARYATSRRSRWIVTLLIVLALGVFNKLNFIWVVNAALIVSAVVVWRERATMHDRRRPMVLWAAGLALIYAGWASYSIANHIRSGFLQPWHAFELGMRGTLAGTWFYNYALGPWSPPSAPVIVTLVLFLGGAGASLTAWRSRTFGAATIALATAILALQILVTGAATAGWHYVSVYPFVSVVAAYGVFRLATALSARKAAATVVMVLAGLCAFGYDGIVMAKYTRGLYREPSFSTWSPSVYVLDRYVRHSRTAVFTADWGIFGPLFALHPSRSVRQLEFKLERPTPAQLSAVRRRLATTTGRRLVITHASHDLVFAAANRNLMRAVGPHLHHLRTIRGRDGTAVYEIYDYR